ncbi:PHP domain-containing protein [Lachnoclostridium phytofermentans]|uniref:Uncharacterized protein n=1 Tax=Lachnoclostridium phytofermentans (strain ATCC 700394 / DSM 18823 / ISDg) TaxID=357809 RepID=A9KS34_LACP7|nr:PHP domain-containing protein [Lachnoclostridium phytofermentans]ABX40665.1 hypothetical protein Cphy_0278 [Lachnoclostridium phytofermentans ISDg]
MKVEMHMHTSEISPCAAVRAIEGVREYKKASYNGIVITDHFNDYVLNGFIGSDREKVARFLTGYEMAKEQGEELGITVFFGIETCLLGAQNDFLLYGLQPEFLYEYPKLYSLSIKELHQVVGEAGGIVVQAHPYRGYCTIEDPKYLDGVEVYNGNPRHNSRNHLAKDFAKHYPHLIETSGSDYHQLSDLASGGMIFPRELHTETELKEALLARDYELIQ